MVMLDYVICHYGEIGLKGKNRKFFEEELVKNIKLALSPAYFEYVKRISGRIIIKLSKKGIKEQKEIQSKIKKVFGIVYFAFSEKSSQNISSLKKDALNLIKEALKQKKSRKRLTFKIETKRSEKALPFTSRQLNEKLGEHILKNASQLNLRELKVDLKKPKLTLFVELVEKYAFLYFEKIAGQGGLPVGASGKAVCLLSGGIDSPVAAYLGMKRGLKVYFAHFHSFPYTSKASIEKVKNLAKILGEYQPKTKLYLVPFAEIQKEIVLKTSPKLRIVLYRRMMFRIAEEIAEKEGAKSLITGESLAQVASQTLENMQAIEEAVKLLILRPLVGMDKSEIIEKAKGIKTYQISILPHEDCCSRFVPKHPETKAGLKEVKTEEKKLNVKKLVQQALKNSTQETL
jgi:thiamine biosynthesis protein ThiI